MTRRTSSTPPRGTVIPFPGLQRQGRKPLIDLWIEAVATDAARFAQDYPERAIALQSIARIAQMMRDHG